MYTVVHTRKLQLPLREWLDIFSVENETESFEMLDKSQAEKLAAQLNTKERG